MSNIKLTHSALLAVLELSTDKDATYMIGFVRLLIEKASVWQELTFQPGDIDDFVKEYDESLKKLSKQKTYQPSEFDAFLKKYFLELRSLNGLPITKDNCESLYENWIERVSLDELFRLADLYGKEQVLAGMDKAINKLNN